MSKALELAKFGREAIPAGAVVGDSDTQTLSNKTFSTNPTISSGTANGVGYLNASKVLTTGSALTWSGTALAVTGTLSASDGTNGNIKAYVDGTSAYLQGLNQAANAYRPLLLMGSTVSLANNGVTNAILDTTGYFGVGTATPTTFVHALGGAASASNVINWNARLSTGASGSSAFGAVGTGIYFDSFTNNGAGTQPIAGVSSFLMGGGTGGATTNHSGGIAFWTKSSTSASLTRQVSIDSEGNLGVGVFLPAMPVDVTKTGVQVGATTGYTVARFRESVAGKGVALGYDSGSQTGIVLSETTGTASNLAFWTYSGSAWGERARIDSAGNLLVGATTINRLGSGATGAAFQLATSSGAEIYLSTSGTTSGEFVGAINFGTTGTSSAAKRSALIGSLLTATSSSVVSGNLVFYTNDAGTLAERMRLNSSGYLFAGSSGPNNGQDYRIGFYKPATSAILLLNADNGYNTYTNYAVYSGGSSFGRNGGTGSFQWNDTVDFGGTTWATLNGSGLYLSGNIYPAAQAAFTVSTSGWVANTFYEVVAPGNLGNQTSYWVVYRWDHINGYPYIIAGAFMMTVVNTNGTGTDNTFTPLGSSHVGGATMSFRTKAGLGASTGLEVSATAITNGSLTLRFYRFA
jgi:hypothetical protein